MERYAYRRAGKHARVCGAAVATFDLHLWGNKPHYFLSCFAVESTHRGKGDGSKLLTEVCQEADTLGVPIELDCSPFDDSPLTWDQTCKLYESFGFKLLSQNKWAHRMVREPQL